MKREHDFTLRHIYDYNEHDHSEGYRRLDIRPGDIVWVESGGQGKRSRLETLHAKSTWTTIERLSDRSVSRMQSLYRTARLTGASPTLDASEWTADDVSGPNVTDKETVLTLAKMSWDAYTAEPGTGEWQDETGRFNHSQGFGWEGDSLRGHIFADKDNTTVVIALKGTSPAVFDGAETTTNDKVNDNLFFGCCCGQGGQYLWHQVCDCMTSAFTCNQTCLVKALRDENRYYAKSIELYGNVTEVYPNSNVWLAGHSLGGSTGALLGLTFGLPVATFEAPGDALAAARLGLPSPPTAHPSAPQTRKFTGAVHFGHTADPIFMGSCNAATSACTLGGYSMQTECHTGCVSRYDTVGDKQWRVGAGYHKIRSVIHDVIEAYPEVPRCMSEEECVDCFNWKFFRSNGSEPSTSTTSSTSSTTATPTRTTTCKTPGWWGMWISIICLCLELTFAGCLDETTTSTTSTSSSTSTSDLPTTSCVKYGWFGGCLETTTVSPTTTPKVATQFPTTSCVRHGWLGGCLETTTITPTTAMQAATPARAPTITTTRPFAEIRPISRTIATKTSI